MIVKVEDKILGTEPERVDHFYEKEVIGVGRENWVEEGGRVKVDSLGNILIIPINQEVYVSVTYVKREVSIYIRSEIIIKDEKRNRVKRNIPIIVNEFLTILCFAFTGDKRALLTNSVE